MGNVGFTTIDMIILIVYLLVVLVAGLLFSKKEMQGKEFFKGDGTVPWYVTSVSIFATLLSPISFMTLAGNSYAGTWLLWFAQLGMIFAIPVAIRFFLPIYARLDIDTAYDYLQNVLVLRPCELCQLSSSSSIKSAACPSLCIYLQWLWLL